jgi:hypothetical protein
MIKLGKVTIFSVTLIGLAALVFLGWHLSQAQVKVQGKPTPPACNNNGTCEPGEYNSSKSWENQPCLDCRLKAYLPLFLDDINPQVISSGNSLPGRVFQFKCTGSQIINGAIVGKYEDTWATANYNIGHDSPAIGDVDNDGQLEIVAAVDYVIGGSKNSKIYDHKLLIFETGSNGNQLEWESPYFGRSTGLVSKCFIADVDNNLVNGNEIVFINNRHLEVKRISKIGSSFNFEDVFSSNDYSNMVWWLDVGDADNMGDNEIVLAVFSSGMNAPRIWKWIGTTFIETMGEAVSCTGMDVAKVRDIDNAPGNEIIAGGNNSKLMVWRYEPGSGNYKWVCSSNDLGGYTQGVDAGDIDGLPGNEIVVGTAGASKLYVFKYVDCQFTFVASISLDTSVNSLTVGDLDMDGKDEMAVNIGDIYLSIYDLENSGLIKTYCSVYGGYAQIK